METVAFLDVPQAPPPPPGGREAGVNGSGLVIRIDMAGHPFQRVIKSQRLFCTHMNIVGYHSQLVSEAIANMVRREKR